MRILLAEDEKALSKALVTILKHNNYSVDAVFNGQDAVDYLSAEIYDLAIFDIMMPIKDGLTAIKEVRQSGNKIPVILLTAKSELDDKIIGLDAGADDYITKPFEIRELLARIRAVARRKTANCDVVLTFGNLHLNCATFELSVGDSSIKLLHKEYQIIELLMERPAAAISTEQIMEKVWDMDSTAELNVVWVYISGLRKKLKALGANVAIKASRNIGYSLEIENDK